MLVFKSHNLISNLEIVFIWVYIPKYVLVLFFDDDFFYVSYVHLFEDWIPHTIPSFDLDQFFNFKYVYICIVTKKKHTLYC